MCEESTDVHGLGGTWSKMVVSGVGGILQLSQVPGRARRTFSSSFPPWSAFLAPWTSASPLALVVWTLQRVCSDVEKIILGFLISVQIVRGHTFDIDLWRSALGCVI